ncbi:carbon-nitrogen hydrolase [Fictibacillus macauensis ZFHKF-1]|uniref:Carbon-nitrogen hydrolase n=1 Tax=Fictibacillus macauensis ZFHKF-1 TaxID=1196324 RepID=I8UC57_9BACL|nr:carbon-nitrogen hydrolase family protein [Fictibacillus macauensis]EIT84378.1 carbon-nitrogen hydrolase [Fictibacillus macauensis ZFHKF-1]
MSSIVVATSQFPVSADVLRNTEEVLRQMAAAKAQGAHVIHFPEGALSGYAGVDCPTFAALDWALLKSCTEEVMLAARHLGIWVLVGSAHPLLPPHKPRNCVYVITDEGTLLDRYDKMFCAGQDEAHGDLAHYSSGNYFCVFSIGDCVCGVQICHDYRYPELYRVYKQRGVDVMFHSYHAGNIPQARLFDMEQCVPPVLRAYNTGSTYPELTMPATMVSYAANHYMWISCSNSSAKTSCWGAFIVQPDGVIAGKLAKHEEGFCLTTIDLQQAYYDSTAAWRDRPGKNMFYSGTLVTDQRSRNRQQL